MKMNAEMDMQNCRFLSLADPDHFIPRKSVPFLRQEADFAPESVWTLKIKISSPCRESNSISSAIQPTVNYYTEIFSLALP
jgi:hypothetical protein